MIFQTELVKISIKRWQTPQLTRAEKAPNRNHEERGEILVIKLRTHVE